MNILTDIAAALIDIVVPSKCVVCSNTVSIINNSLCGKCLDKIEYIHEKCPKCSGIIEGQTCTICADREFYVSKNISITEYNGVIKDILHNIKFNNMRNMYKFLGNLAYRELQHSDLNFDIISSIPMNREKKYARGYNQSALIARYLAKKTEKSFTPVLRERAGGGTQRDYGYRDRFVNVLDRYYTINRKKFFERKILIIDDVFTTGSTINEAARILLNSGANQVFSLTIARAGIKKLEKF